MLPIRPTKPSLYAVFCAELGQSVFNADGKPLVDTPQSLQAMHLFKEIYDAGIGQNYNGWDEYEGTVANQTVATIPEAVWMIGTIKDKAPDTAGKWGVIDLPKISAGGSSSCANGGSVVAIHAKTAVPDLVKEFVKFAMTDTALQAGGFEKYGLYPSFIPSYSEPVFEQGDDFFGGDAIYNVFIENGKKIPAFPQNPNIAEANDMIGAAVSRILLKNEDIDTTLIELQRDLSTKFAR
ncbi:extracellular solute-binding protein [Treponema vincentii]|uniref:extracellular solute-binding protein n=2 Tax=Treponema TaxID=157 RepID=UPI0022AA5156|nr:extracellular solute-binding protein [Treponema vincentii]